MVIRSLQRQFNEVGDKKELKQDEMQVDACSKEVLNIHCNVHCVSLVIQEQSKDLHGIRFFYNKGGTTRCIISKCLTIASTSSRFF
jgi:hypothetical protein